MPRRLKVLTHETGPVELYLIYDEGGVWEDEWRSLQEFAEIAALHTVSKEAMEQALIGWTKPLVDSLGPVPQGRLLTLPKQSRQCSERKNCPFYDEKKCSHLDKGMPWCFVPDLPVEPEVSRLLAELIKLWREGVYVVLVREP